MRCRINRDALQLADHFAAQRVDFVNRFDLVAEELHSHGALLFVRGKISTVSPRTRNVPRWKS